MRRFMLAAALALALAGGAVGGASASPPAAKPSLAKLEGEIMCPTCHTTLDQSDAAIAKRIEAYMHRRIAAGASEKQIKAELVAQFGTAILAAPPKRGFDLLAWVLPFAGLGGAGALIALSMRRWRDEGLEQPPLQPLDVASEALVDAALAEFDRPQPVLRSRVSPRAALRPVAPVEQKPLSS